MVTNIIKRQKYYIAIILLVVITGYFVFIQNRDNENSPASIADTFKCPADYTDNKTYKADLNAFVADYLDNNPNATEGDLMAERDRLFIEHECIDRYFENIGAYPDWCPISPQEVIATIEYLRNLKTEEVLSIIKLLSDRKCKEAIYKITEVMSKEIESGTSPGSKL